MRWGVKALYCSVSGCWVGGRRALRADFVVTAGGSWMTPFFGNCEHDVLSTQDV